MKKKLLTSLGCLALVAASAVGLAACGKTEDKSVVSFGAKGYYMDTDVNVKSYNWTKQKLTDEDKNADVPVVESYKINADQEIAYVKFNGDFAENNGNIIAIVINTKGHDDAKFGKVSLKESSSQTPTALEDSQTTDKEGKPVNEHRFVYFSSIDAETKGFILYADWEGDGKYDAGYKFVIDGSTLDFAPAV